MGFGMDLLKPRCWETSQEAVWGLGVDVVKQSGEVGERQILTKLPFQQVVKDLMCHPVQDVQSHLVGSTTQLSVVDPQAEFKVGA